MPSSLNSVGVAATELEVKARSWNTKLPVASTYSAPYSLVEITCIELRAVRAVPGSACIVVRPGSISRIEAGQSIASSKLLIRAPDSWPALVPATVAI